jgi:hypothetical protein
LMKQIANKLLTRQEFKRQVFARDKNSCVVCGKLAVDAHHILDRKLWPDGGYYLDNGVSLCEDHHWDAELSRLSPDHLRTLANIQIRLLPPHLDPNLTYDKWGNPTKEK